MTAGELEALVLQAKDPWALQKAMAGLDDAQRAKLSTAAQQLMTQLARNKAGATASPRLKAVIAARGVSRWQHLQSRENANATLALFGVGPLSAVKRRDGFLSQKDRAAVAQIIKDRRPDWIDAYIAHELEQAFSAVIEFPMLRSWIKDGVCAKPETEGYYRMFAAHLMRTIDYPGRTPAPPISRQLLDDPDLIPDVVGMFRVETIAFNTNSWLVKGSSGEFETWPQALVKLTRTGDLDRTQILDLCLASLSLDIKQNQLAGYHNLYEAMEPTPEDLARDQSQFIQLLAHPVAHVAKFGLDNLGRLDKAGGLDAEAVVREIPEVFVRGNKGNALAALRLIARLTKTASKDLALTAACEALRHGHVEVQAKALEVLEANSKSLGPAHIGLISDLKDAVGASNRAQLSALIAAGDPPTQAVAIVEAPPGKPGQDAYVPILVLGDAPVLFEAARIQPIASVDDLIDAVFHAVEVLDSADELERIISAMSRLAADRPTDFARRVDPLLHRLKAPPTSGKGLSGLRYGIGRTVLDLIHTWATGRLHHTPQIARNLFREQNAFAPMTSHLREVAAGVARRRRGALLSEPTHSGGWVDPTVWVARLLAHADGVNIRTGMDLRLSLGRLAPDMRYAALEQAKGIKGDLGRVSRFALGGDERPGKADRANAAIWVAAARCRRPTEDWSQELAALGITGNVPGVLRPARFAWTSSHQAGEAGGTRWKHARIDIEVDCVPAAGPAPRGVGQIMDALGNLAPIDWKTLPSAAMSHPTETHPVWSSDLNARWTQEWLSFVWPQEASGAYAQAVNKAIWRIDEGSSGWEPNHGFFHALFQPGRPWEEMGHLMLAVGLVGRDADVKGVALDALIEGINARLLDPQMFGRVLQRLCAGGWVKLNRLAENLLQAAKMSSHHNDLIDQALQGLLTEFNFNQTGAAAVLEVFVETRATAAGGLAPAVRTALTGLTGASKAAKLAKRLL